MSTSRMGARVIFCGHLGWFVADIFTVGNVNVVRANGPVTPANIKRSDMDRTTHQVVDHPVNGFWRPDLGVFVVPQDQVIELKTVPNPAQLLRPKTKVAMPDAAFRVHAYLSGGTYLARCQGQTASCTSDRESAARRAAAKAWSKLLGRKIKDGDVRLSPMPEEGNFYARVELQPSDKPAIAAHFDSLQGGRRE